MWPVESGEPGHCHEDSFIEQSMVLTLTADFYSAYEMQTEPKQFHHDVSFIDTGSIGLLIYRTPREQAQTQID